MNTYKKQYTLEEKLMYYTRLNRLYSEIKSRLEDIHPGHRDIAYLEHRMHQTCYKCEKLEHAIIKGQPEKQDWKETVTEQIQKLRAPK